MITRIDHVVIVVTDLDQAIQNYRALGFTVVSGGHHLAGLTKNALIGFHDGAYLELVTYIDFENAPGHRWHWAYRRGGGVEDLCLGASDLAADVRALTAAGIAYTPPRFMGRDRPDGQRVEWRLGHAPSGAIYLPFLIEDITPRDLRVPSGADAHHANGVLGIHEVIVATADRSAARDHYATLTQQPGEPVAPPHEALVNGATRFPLGDASIVLAAPDTPDNVLQERYATRGGGPWRVILRGGPDSPRGPLAPSLTRGADLVVI